MRRLQARAIKAVTNYELNPRPELNRLLNFESVYYYFTLSKLYRVLVEHSHVYIRDRLQNIQINHDHYTRFKCQQCLITPLYRKSKCLASFAYQSIKIWNKLPIDIKSCSSRSLFKRELKQYLVLIQESLL